MSESPVDLSHRSSGSTRSGGAPSQLASTFISQMLSNNALESHILERLQPAYARRYHSLRALICQHLLPLGVAFTKPEDDLAGGFFFWLRLPAPLKASQLAQKAQEEENLLIAKGNLFKVNGVGGSGGEADDFEGYIRICLAWEEEDRFAEGVERLASLIRREISKESKET